MLPAHQHRTRQLSHLPSLRLPNFPTSRQVEKLASWQVGKHQGRGEHPPVTRPRRPTAAPPLSPRSPSYPAGRPNAANPPHTLQHRFLACDRPPAPTANHRPRSPPPPLVSRPNVPPCIRPRSPAFARVRPRVTLTLDHTHHYPPAAAARIQPPEPLSAAKPPTTSPGPGISARLPPRSLTYTL